MICNKSEENDPKNKLVYGKNENIKRSLIKIDITSEKSSLIQSLLLYKEALNLVILRFVNLR